MNYYSTVAILTKNPGNILKDVLNSVLIQKTTFDYEILVVDSGSTDGTVEYLKSIKKVRLIEIKPSDFGHGKTRNFAIENAKGQYIAMLTHDAQPVNENWLQNLVSIFDKDPLIAGAFGRHYAYPDASLCTKRDLKLHFDGFQSWPSVMGIEDQARYNMDQGYRQVLHFFSDNNACIKKEVWKKKPYPEVDFAEDQLWCKSIIESGFKRAYVDDAIVFHSHNYSLLETFKRSYDESRALKNLFGYELCKNLRTAFFMGCACSMRDLSYIKKNGILKNKVEAIKTPFLQFCKQFGFFIGNKNAFFANIHGILSLDNKKKEE